MSLPGKIETTANIATIGAAVLLSAVLIKVYLVPGLLAGKRTATQAADAAIGTSLKERIGNTSLYAETMQLATVAQS